MFKVVDLCGASPMPTGMKLATGRVSDLFLSGAALGGPGVAPPETPENIQPFPGV